MDPRAEQRLVGVDVPDARDSPLIAQERFDGGDAAAGRLAKPLGSELRRERLDPEPSGQILLARLAAVYEVARPEPPWIDVHETVAGVQLEAHAGVRRIQRGMEQQRARLAKVQQQVAVPGESPHQVLAR